MIAVRLKIINAIAGLLISNQSKISPSGIKTIIIGFVITPIKNNIISTTARTISDSITFWFALVRFANPEYGVQYKEKLMKPKNSLKWIL